MPSPSPRLLLITPDPPGHTRSGTEQRSHLLYSALRKSAEVDVLVLRGADKTSVDASRQPGILATLAYGAKGGSLATVRTDAVLSRWFAEHVDWQQYAAVVARSMPSLAKIELPRSVPVILDLDDAVRRFAAPRMGMPLSLGSRAIARLRTTAYRRLLTRASHVFFCSQLDRDAYPGVPSSVLPNVTALPSAQSTGPSQDSRTILFVGALWYGPNRDGVEWMVRRVWPRVRTRCPDATLRLVGAASEEVRSRWSRSKGVEAPGFVDDLSAEYRNAAFTVAPLWYGAGTSIKILESLAHERTSVLTELAHRPLKPELVAGRAVLVAHDEESMAAKCEELLTLKTLRDAMGVEGRRAVASAFSRERFKQEVARVLDAIVGRRTPLDAEADPREGRERADLDV